MSREKSQAEALRWRDQAAADLRAAENSTRAGNHEWACFQAQQAAEKALKAVWLANGFEPWGHSVLKLLEGYPDASVRARHLDPLQAAAKALDKLYIPTRYPNGLPDLAPFEVYTDLEAQAAISAARSVLSACGSLLPAAASADRK
jgi:HEPN domain-containing protein